MGNGLPKDFSMRTQSGIVPGGTIEVHATLASTHELDAVVSSLRIVRGLLSSHREMVAGDIGLAVPAPSYADALVEFLG